MAFDLHVNMNIITTYNLFSNLSSVDDRNDSHMRKYVCHIENFEMFW